LFRPLKIFGAQKGPCQVDEQAGGNDAAKYQIEHGSNFLTAGDVQNQKEKNDSAVDYGNGVAHGAPTFPSVHLRRGA
jgi:hypothetical protein